MLVQWLVGNEIMQFDQIEELAVIPVG